MSAYPLGGLKSDFNAFLLAKQAHQPDARSSFFACCGSYYEAVFRQKSHLKDDRFLLQAKNLEDFFGHAPGSMNRLSLKADNYRSRWKDLRTFMKNSNSSDSQLCQALRSLVVAHQRFVGQVIKEAKISRKETSEAAQMSCWPTLKLFYGVVLDALIQNPDQIEQVENLLETADPRCFQSVPYQAMLKVLHQMEQAPDSQEIRDLKKCELHGLLAEEIQEWSKSYQCLKLSDKTQLFSAQTLFSEDLNLSGLSILGRELFNKISSRTYRYGENDPVVFSSLASPFCRFILEDISLAKKLAQSDALYKMHSGFDDFQEALEVLRSLSSEEYRAIKDNSEGFQFLPEKSADLQEEHIRKRYFYRIVSVIALARSIKLAHTVI